MKNLLKLLSITILISFISCEKPNEKTIEKETNSIVNSIVNSNKSNFVNSKESAMSLDLKTKYNLPEDVYNEFIESLTFDEKGNFRGAIYIEVEKYLDDNSSDEFWNNFGVSLRNNSTYKGPTIYEGYRYKGPHSCKQNRRWICSLDGDPIGG
jgi:hypothetical protein